MAVPKDDEKRRAGGAIRVPFVRRCQIDYTGGQTDSAFIVNINVLGAYVAHEVMPALGRTLVFRFHVPGSEREVVVDGVVAWTNPQQEHPVHSLPARLRRGVPGPLRRGARRASSRSSSTTWPASPATELPGLVGGAGLCLRQRPQPGMRACARRPTALWKTCEKSF